MWAFCTPQEAGQEEKVFAELVELQRRAEEDDAAEADDLLEVSAEEEEVLENQANQVLAMLMGADQLTPAAWPNMPFQMYQVRLSESVEKDERVPEQPHHEFVLEDKHLKKIPDSADLCLGNTGVLQLNWQNAMDLGSEESAATFTKITDHMRLETAEFLEQIGGMDVDMNCK
ncbi:hypothetical protein K438DRAFT_1970262 [Mycena galopus ATCC 62051]|nr:hypothetical protein K438DRAFT_1970262 [Mycena galopus ATCC 62051]